ncbi:hypothetical protein [Granulicella sibirica]|uniref:Uncharacterized protein n=1 Tax=Granulicella sibirica TaxID=2479048 RepID=A0A4V1L675_9BACT|nr:hypothetical protein [Granulicella sibirica]RXH58284.1 hypothetical protein GRAN_1594 [Granulicella sibirica]
MATTTILFATDEVVPTPSVSSVHVVSGDGIHLAIEGDGTAVLYFSADLAKILSPAPESTFVLSGTTEVTYTFTSSEEGMYQILVSGENEGKPHFTAPASSYLEITRMLSSGDAGLPIPFGGSRGNNAKTVKP